MTQPSPSPTPNRSVWLYLALILAASGGLFVLASQQGSPPTPRTDEHQDPTFTHQATMLPDSAPVIGVHHNGHYRAYPVSLLMKPTDHVQNHVLGGAAVSVTYCDLDQCTRVFHAPQQPTPLTIKVGSDNRRPRKMVVEINRIAYWQDTGEPVEATTKLPLPYSVLDHVQTTWGEWRTQHPSTERYIGDGKFVPNG